MNKIFFISGLGADKRVFKRIDEFDGYEKVFVDWKSSHPEESIAEYALRLIENFNVKPQDIIIGLSFGGLIAQVLGAHFKLKKIILISSFRSNNDLTFSIRILLKLKLYYIIPSYRVKLLDKVIAKWFGIKSKEANSVLKDMIDETDMLLLKWSIHQIDLSDKEISNNSVYNLIGSKDKIVNVWKNEYTSIIPYAGHFMVYENSPEINNVLKVILN